MLLDGSKVVKIVWTPRNTTSITTNLTVLNKILEPLRLYLDVLMFIQKITSICYYQWASFTRVTRYIALPNLNIHGVYIKIIYELTICEDMKYFFTILCFSSKESYTSFIVLYYQIHSSPNLGWKAGRLTSAHNIRLALLPPTFSKLTSNKMALGVLHSRRPRYHSSVLIFLSLCCFP